MRKKNIIGLIVSITLILPSLPIFAEEHNTPVVPVHEQEVITETVTNKDDALINDNTESIEASLDAPAVASDDVIENQETEALNVSSNEKDDSKENAVSKKEEKPQARAVGIDSEALLTQALNEASGDAVIEVVGGTTINLTKPLSINTSKVTRIRIQSTNDEPVTLNHANNQRHIAVTGTGVLDLTMNNVILSTDANHGTSKGGLELTNNLIGNKISGLDVRDNPAVASGWNSGFLVFTSNGGSLDLTNSTFINNGINVRNAVSSAFVMIDTQNADVNFDNVRFSNNKKINQSGGMISIYAKNGAITMNNVSMIDNEAASNSAGVFFTGSGTATLAITNSNFDGNTNTEGMGGAINLRLKDSSATSISHSDILNNHADRGGSGINVMLESSNGLTLDTITVDGNTASRNLYDPETEEQSGTSSSGGGIYVEQMREHGYVNILNTTISNNIAGSGGGFYLYTDYSGNTEVSITDSIITGNIADYHAGALDFNTYGNSMDEGLISIKNTQITKNTVTGNDPGPGWNQGGYGGAIHYGNFENSPGALQLDGVTFSENKSAYPVEWSLSTQADDALTTVHQESILNTTYSASQSPFMPQYDNAYNGDDIYLGHSAIVYFDPNPDMIEGLDAPDYSESLNYALTVMGQKIQEPSTPSIPGYRFVGWFDEADNQWDFTTTRIQEVHQYLHAKWEKIETYVVSFDLNGGDSIQPESQNLEANELVTEPEAPTRLGYTFVGWGLGKNDSNNLWNFATDAVGQESVVLYAQWKAIVPPVEMLTVTFDLNGGLGSFELSQVVTAGSKVSRVVNPTREGYTFLGWKLQTTARLNQFWNFDTDLVERDIVLIAQWEKNPEVPEVPEIPEVPEVPETPEVPEAPTTSETLPATGVDASYGVLLGSMIVFVGLAIIIETKRRSVK
ncbi:InlB B-repeat-containing protein [Erysipelothrix anatis]|uniref:InlB B-repeat-containing protein n=1 Tax=Erysipelothrix anatis TaxID=2683713 RepID=UPI0013599485|nr:InlB B-repeat-containing protein [Erysipelothrix anatis]